MQYNASLHCKYNLQSLTKRHRVSSDRGEQNKQRTSRNKGRRICDKYLEQQNIITKCKTTRQADPYGGETTKGKNKKLN